MVGQIHLELSRDWLEQILFPLIQEVLSFQAAVKEVWVIEWGFLEQDVIVEHNINLQGILDGILCKVGRDFQLR